MIRFRRWTIWFLREGLVILKNSYIVSIYLYQWNSCTRPVLKLKSPRIFIELKKCYTKEKNIMRTHVSGKKFLGYDFKEKYRAFIKSPTHDPVLKSQLDLSALLVPPLLLVLPLECGFFISFPKAKVTFQTLLQNRLIRIIKCEQHGKGNWILFCFQVALKFVKRNSVSEYKKVSKCHNNNINKHNNTKKQQKQD